MHTVPVPDPSVVPPPPRKPQMRRTLAAGSVALLSLLVLTPGAAADRPVAGCGAAFTLQPVTDFGPGFQAFLAKVDRNGDRMVCTLLLPEALPFPNIDFVDNVAVAR